MPALYISVPAKPPGILPCVADRLGLLLRSLCAGCLPLLLPARPGRLLLQLLVFGIHGREHFHLHAPGRRIVSLALVRLSPGAARGSGRLRRSAHSCPSACGASSG